jgi:single-strand DNA-binding protein
MSQGAYVTLVGYVAQDPNLRTTPTGKPVTDLRVGVTPRIRDNRTGDWRDGQASYFTVSCWERLAHHVRASMHKGDPVLVKGKLQTRTYEDRDGNSKTEARITADTVGHDLSRGIANYMGNRSRQAAQDGGRADGQASQSQASQSQALEGQAPESQAADGQAPEGRAPGSQNAEQWPGPDEMLDEDAIERFGRDLDDTDVAARALAEDAEGQEDEDGEDGEDGDSAAAAAPPVAAPF